MNGASIKINNKIVKIDENIPLGVALYKSGVTYFETSFKFNRPRGALSFEWWSPERVYVDGYGPVNHYLMKTKNGLSIKIEKRVFQRLFMNIISPYLKVGFQHGKFFRSKIGWSLTWKFMKSSLPYSKIPENIIEYEVPKPITIDVDVVVIGSGVSGLSAAVAAKTAGANVVVLEGDDIVGGHLAYDFASIEKINRSGSDLVQNLLRDVERNKINIINGTALTAVLDDALIGVQFNEPTGKPVLVRSKSIVIASGAREVLTVFGNNDLPGIILGSSALKLVNVYKVNIGKRVSIIGSNNWAARIALQLSQKTDVTLIDTQNKISEFYKKLIANSGVRHIIGYRVIRAMGSKRVTGIHVSNNKESFNIDTEAVILASVRSPAIEIPGQMGVPLGFHTKMGGFVPIHGWGGETAIKNVFITGEVGGVIDEAALIPLSKAVGLNAAYMSGIKVSERDIENYINEGKSLLNPDNNTALEELVRSFERGEVLNVNNDDMGVLQNTEDKKSFLCPCVDITTHDIKNVIENLGWTDIEKIKRYSGLGTGRCQGKYCYLASVLYISQVSNTSPSQVGLFKMRPPVIPIPFSVIGGFEQ